MTQRYTLQPNCFGIDLPDGTKYKAKNGSVEVSDDHARFIDQSYTKKGLEYIEKKLQIVGSTIQGKICGGCLFSAFLFTAKCPRCGGTEWTKETV